MTTALRGDEDLRSNDMNDVRSRLIDEWFPCTAVDAAVTTPTGSGRSEKALFTWFASRPIAQARAAVLTALLPNDPALQLHVRSAIEEGGPGSLNSLAHVIRNQYPEGRPVLLDMFSGRGIIPLEAARLGVTAVGTDLSPVATLAGRLLADYSLRDWSSEPPLPYADTTQGELFDGASEPRLLADVRSVLAEVENRTTHAVERFYPRDVHGRFPWAYLWSVTIPCDQCKRVFPLVGSMTLRFPYKRTDDSGQALHLEVRGETWHSEVIEGLPVQAPTFSSAQGRRGKAGHCLFCGHLHTLETIKLKGKAGQFRDALLAVADGGDGPHKTFRRPTAEEIAAAAAAESAQPPRVGSLAAIPDEQIPEGNTNTIQALVFGYTTFGALMNRRQNLQFVAMVEAIRAVHAELLVHGITQEYAAALAAYCTANIPRKLRLSTRGAHLRPHGNSNGTEQNRVQIGDMFSRESVIMCNLDYVEAGPGMGPGTWNSVAQVGLNALRKVMTESPIGKPARFRRASAVALPFRDGSVDVVLTDPPYYDMITYADASDVFYVWLKRALQAIMPDLFDPATSGPDGLQDKSEEIIVKSRDRGSESEHRTREFYERMLSRAFAEARRVLRPDGHLVVVFGHSDPDAWNRLLTALHDAGFIVTSSWPSRTETTQTGVASIRVTITIGCRVSPPHRKPAPVAQVDREVREAVKRAARAWDQDGLALPDQVMAAYGPAMEVYGRYSRVLMPAGEASLDRYLASARTAVREAAALRLDELPLETFDAPTRFAVFWHRLYGRGDVPKGEARFMAQGDGLRIEDLRVALLTESKSGYRLRLDDPGPVTDRSSTIEVVRAMGAAWERGGTEAVGAVLAAAGRLPNDEHLWAVVGELVSQLPQADALAKALAAVQRNASTIANLVKRASAEQAAQAMQMPLLGGGESDTL